MCIRDRDIIWPYMKGVDEIYNLACPASPVHYQCDPIKTINTSVFGMVDVYKRQVPIMGFVSPTRNNLARTGWLRHLLSGRNLSDRIRFAWCWETIFFMDNILQACC